MIIDALVCSLTIVTIVTIVTVVTVVTVVIRTFDTGKIVTPMSLLESILSSTMHSIC